QRHVLATGGQNVSLTTTGSGNVTLTGMTNAGVGNVSVTSAGNVEGGGAVTGTIVSLSAVSGIGDSASLNTQASNLNASSINGDVVLNNNLATAVALTNLSTGTGHVIFNQTGTGAVTATTV